MGQMLCSICLKPPVSEQLADKQLLDDSEMIKKRLFQFASEADTTSPGALDDPSCHMKRMPDELKELRKKGIGRHRVYYTGNHRACNYDVVLIKPFKKAGTDDDDDRAFQRRLINILADRSTKSDLIELPKV